MDKNKNIGQDIVNQYQNLHISKGKQDVDSVKKQPLKMSKWNKTP